MAEQPLSPEAVLDELGAQARDALEWPRLLALLADRAISEPGIERLLRLTPKATREEALAWTRRVRAVLALRRDAIDLPLTAFTDLGPILARVRLGADTSGAELNQVRRVIELALGLRASRLEHPDRPELGFLGATEPRLDRVAARLRGALEPDGNVADAASPALAEARARVREIQGELKHRLTELARRHAEILQGQYTTERDGRTVLPVRADAHYRLEGIVLGSSASGSTLFVEPREVTDLGNRLRVRQAAVEREEARVLSELCALVRDKLSEIGTAFEIAVEADVLWALSRWACETDSEPLDVGADPEIELHAARHPLLLLSGIDVVQNDVDLRAGEALVISGPNAGGKTVTLKCLGLFAWMVRAGIPVPAAANSRMGWFDRVLADIGDEQSLTRSLSTFSAHIETLTRIFAHAGRHALVLLDEVAAGTDPEEGAALAAAALEGLAGTGAAVAATTHYERLKELAAQKGRLKNASVGFDFTRMQPTFRLTLGVPGPSSALIVAQRHGLPAALVERAHELLPTLAHDRERAVHELKAERARAETERRALQEQRQQELDLRSRRALEQEREAEAARILVEQERARLTEEIRSIRGEIEQARRRLRETPRTARDLRQIERAVGRAVTRGAAGTGALGRALPEPPTEPGVEEADLIPGARVRQRATGALGTVLEAPSRGSVLLRIGAVRLRERIDALSRAPGAPAKPSGPKPAPRSRAQPDGREALRTRDNTLDLRGVRVEDAPDRIDAFIDRMLGEGEPLGFVLHGHGTGALRKTVRDHLGSSAHVERVRPAEAGEGGDAFTVFWVG